jgi:DNA ligase-4
LFGLLDCSSAIFDGEMLVLETETGLLKPFGHLKTAANDLNVNGMNVRLRPYFRVFDLVYINEQVNYLSNIKDITDKPLTYRYNLLKSAFTPVPGLFDLVPHEIKSTTADVVTSLEDAIQSCEEGIIIKCPTSRYEPSGRGTDWLKIKPDYLDSMDDNLDLIVLNSI